MSIDVHEGRPINLENDVSDLLLKVEFIDKKMNLIQKVITEFAKSFVDLETEMKDIKASLNVKREHEKNTEQSLTCDLVANETKAQPKELEVDLKVKKETFNKVNCTKETNKIAPEKIFGKENGFQFNISTSTKIPQILPNNVESNDISSSHGSWNKSEISLGTNNISLGDFFCILFKKDEFNIFKRVESFGTIAMEQIDTWTYVLKIGRRFEEKPFTTTLINSDLITRFDFEKLSVYLNICSNDGKVNIWEAEFKNKEQYDDFQKVFTVLKWQQKKKQIYSPSTTTQSILLDEMLNQHDDQTVNKENNESEKGKLTDDSIDISIKIDNEKSFKKFGQNSRFVLNPVDKQLYVWSNNNISVFKTVNKDVKFVNAIKLEEADGLNNNFSPRKMIVKDNSTNLIVQSESSPSNLYQVDLVKGKIVENWRIYDLQDITTNKKFGDLLNDPTFLGVTSNYMCKFDTRLKDNIKAYTGREYASNVLFQNIETTTGGHIAIGSQTGEIKLYSGLNINASVALPSHGDITNLCISSTGRYILATGHRELLLTDLGDDRGFSRRFHIGAKPTPKRITITLSHWKYIEQSSSSKNISFYKAILNDTPWNLEPTSIVTSIGNFVIRWNLGNLSKYDIYHYTSNVIGVSIDINNSKNIIVTCENEIDIITG